ncbi:MAG: InlB B-repeat-containing protein [Kiritimatiellia bacterium]
MSANTDNAARFAAGRVAAQLVAGGGTGARFVSLRRTLRLPFTVHLDADGGTLAVASLACVAGEPVGPLPSPTRGADWFEGWLDAHGGAVTERTPALAPVETIRARYTEAANVYLVVPEKGNPSNWVVYATGHAWEGHPADVAAARPSPITDPETGGELFFAGWWTAPEGGARVTAETVYDGSWTTLYARYAARSFEVDNSMDGVDGAATGWRRVEAGESAARDGCVVFASTNNGRNSTAQRVMVRVVGYTGFRVVIRSDAESNYDYTQAFAADHEPQATIGDTDGLVESTKGRQNQDVEVVYELDGGEHELWFSFRKDSSQGQGADEGYLIIPEEQA